MDRRSIRVMIKNAFANVIRGASGALLALVLPPFLTRAMSQQEYGAWALVLQLSAYVGYLDFGVQTAVGRYVAHATERKDQDHRDEIINSAVGILAFAAGLALTALLVLVPLLPRLFPEMPSGLMHDSKLALLVVGGSLAIGLPASVINGIFVGFQRNEIPAMVIAGSRLLTAALLIPAARAGWSVTALGFIVAGVNLASYLAQYLALRKLHSAIHIGVRRATRDCVRELGRYCTSLTVWSAAMMMISGLDLAILGHFDFNSTAHYAVAVTLITFMAGTQNAIFSAMIPSSAILHARGDSKELGNLLLESSRYGALLVITMGLPLVIFARPIVTVWVGASYAQEATPIVQILAIANMIRLSATPYAVLLIGTGQQRLMVLTPVIEGVTNVVCSIVLVVHMGAVGVAIGTLIGAIVAVAGNLLYNMPKTAGIQFSRLQYVREVLWRPFLCCVPVLAGLLLMKISTGTNSRTSEIAVVSLALMLSAVSLWRIGFSEADRQRLTARWV